MGRYFVMRGHAMIDSQPHLPVSLHHERRSVPREIGALHCPVWSVSL